MEIKFFDYSGGNWITADETKPVKKDSTLELINGSWRISGNGRAEINSIVILNDGDLTSILVGYRYYGKYKGGSQYYQHYKNGIKKSFNNLSEQDKLRILDCNFPCWAKPVGKLKKDYLNNPDNPNNPSITEYEGQTIIAYKYLNQDENGNFYSSYGIIPAKWENGSLDADKIPEDDNTHGIYAAKKSLSPILENYKNNKRKLVKLFLSGKVIEFRYGFRAEHADIVEVLN
jgi:hypothetical protein